MKKRRDRNEVLDAVLKVLEEKGDPVAWFVNEGYEAPIQAWQALRKWAVANRPEDAEKLPQDLRRYYADNGIKRHSKDVAAPKASETPTVPKEAVKSVFFGGKEYEKMDKPSPACCQPARPSGVTVPDQLPDNLPICAVKSNVAGKWELARTDGFVHLIYQETQCLTLHADKWMELAQEIPRMLKQLGL